MDEEDVERCSDEDNQSLDSLDGDEYEQDEIEQARRRRESNRRRRRRAIDDDDVFELGENNGAGSGDHSSSDNPMDALEQEELSDLGDDDAARAVKEGAKRK